MGAMQQTKKRVVYVDYMKSLGMMTIIWGHIMLIGITNAVVYAFHIPLFFFLSGLMFCKDRYPYFGEFFKKRVKSLLVPYVIYSFLTWGVWVGYTYFTHAQTDSYWMPLLQTFIAQGPGNFLVHNVPLWFVSCLFVLEMMYFFIAKLQGTIKAAVCILCGVAGYLMTQENSFFDFRLLPWSIEVAFAAVPFYALGNYLTEHFTHEKMIRAIQTNKMLSFVIFILSFVGVVSGASFNGAISMGSNHLGNFFVFYGAALCGIVMMFIGCVALSALKTNKLLAFIEWFGVNSYTSMAIHNPIKGIVVVGVGALTGTGTLMVAGDYLLAAIAFVVTLVATCIGILIINVLKDKFIK